MESEVEAKLSSHHTGVSGALRDEISKGEELQWAKGIEEDQRKGIEQAIQQGIETTKVVVRRTMLARNEYRTDIPPMPELDKQTLGGRLLGTT